MREIRTEIDIDAPTETIWNVLTDLERFSEWNPFITEASGEVREGGRLTVRIEPPGGTPMTFRPTVTRVEEERELRWLGRLLLPRVFDGEHIFELSSPGEGTTRFVQREQFRGILVPPLWKSLDTNTREGFRQMNAALKNRAEERAGRWQ